MNQSAKDYFYKKLQAKQDVTDRVVTQDFIQGAVKNVHFTGICGKAMASLAGLFVKAGYQVTGSDTEWNPPMSTMLEHLGIQFKQFSPENLATVDLVIIGNAYGPSNVEAVEARKKNIPQISSAEAYAQFFIKDARSIVITGTHGKTTTSSLAAHMVISSGTSPNVLVGGVMKNINESYYFGGTTTTYSVVEGDEYDTAYFDKSPKFLHYRPAIGVVTSIEFDHADIYENIDDYLAAFTFFAHEIPEKGYLLLNDQINSKFQKSIRANCSAPIYTYGCNEKSDARIVDHVVDHKRNGQVFTVEIEGIMYKDLFIPQFGIYNIENALAVVTIAIKEGISERYIRAALENFMGAEQRQQIVYDQKGVIVIEDFAHHPTAVSCTLQGIRDQYPTKRIIAVFEPRSATSRRKDFEQPYGAAFDAADIAIIARPPVRPGDNTDLMMDIKVVIDSINARGTTAYSFDTVSEILQYLAGNIQQNDLIVIMSNGAFGNIVQLLIQQLDGNTILSS